MTERAEFDLWWYAQFDEPWSAEQEQNACEIKLIAFIAWKAGRSGS